MSSHDASPATRTWHAHAFVLDSLMNDYAIEEPYLGQVKRGGVRAAFYDFGAGYEWDDSLHKLNLALGRIDRSDDLALACCARDVMEANREGRLALILGCQTASFVGPHLWRLEVMCRLGVRWLQLTYSFADLYGDGCAERRNGGLTFLGSEFIAAMNDLPMMLDLSHCGHRTSTEAVELARAPICTHANSYEVNPNDRNKRDDVVSAIAEKGGMIGVCGLPSSVKSVNPQLDDWLDHCDHFVRLVGPDRVGIGGDYMEGYKSRRVVPPESRRNRTLRPDIFGTVDDFLKESYPAGADVVEKLPNFTQGLFDRGYDEESVYGVLGQNWLQTFASLVG